MQLSQHFFLHEFTRSQLAANMGRTIEADSIEISNLTRLCHSVYEPLRVYMNRVITITSGLRPLWLNDLEHGAHNSAHLYGCAGDCIVQGMTPREVCEAVKKLDLPVEQCILEFPERGWTHLSCPSLLQTPKREYLTAVLSRGKKSYLPGLIAQA